MMETNAPFLLTGASGFIGRELLRRLEAGGHAVHVLLRDPKKLKGHASTTKIFAGDIQDVASIEAAMAGCRGVYHLASYVDIWAKDAADFYKVNVGGTENLCLSALRHGVERFVLVSTAGTLGASSDPNHPRTENSVREGPFMNDYEASKFVAEERALRHIKNGLDVRIALPPRVFGPGSLDKSNGYTTVMRDYARGRLRFIPGSGNEVGNYAYISDLVEGIVQVMERGRSGERYLLGGENLSFREFFRKVGDQCGRKTKLISIPAGFISFFARISQLWSAISGSRPPVTPEYVDRFRKSYYLSPEKAIQELGYRITPFPEAVKKTLDWLDSQES